MALIAIGANLPGYGGNTPIETCRAAAAALDGLCGLKLAVVSRWYETVPVPPVPGVPRYVNGVARLEGADMDPAALLAALQGLEERAGRQRPYPNAPRTLDLDIVAIGDMVRAAPDPVLPHPRAHLRRFVLEPLRDVAPGWVHPSLGVTVEALLAGLAAEEAPVPIGG
ncbi:2-amino-4-hydroxy-6-hydroxymethyldihydropteridine diphosphokinase [Belnapia sp. T18]|uniref:2-amino-4-hydroxy-6-hydroxymethyldihydropteridine pyrophosphokinase n=1 Tax=Belnapia arida TaxID=2804533 RepID=A0ABS1TYH5_9PROT|nr:2-amino-4-hydroxy-6-hydroxymethyldihydropteridine diphosphokinase [Belnapia arida]MBL6077479.1 2-amino-4-hydroxy-6-hydroxymethyldihydropteridine diphosphokinase [Belnapia arida]